MLLILKVSILSEQMSCIREPELACMTPVCLCIFFFRLNKFRRRNSVSFAVVSLFMAKNLLQGREYRPVTRVKLRNEPSVF